MVTLIKNALSATRLVVNHIDDREFLTWAFRHRRRLRQFQDRHAGQACFIIGNGPSLNRMDLSLLAECSCFGLNKIFMHPQFESINLDYHVAVNPLVVQQSGKELRELKCPSFISFRACDGEMRNDPRFYFLMTKGGPYGFSPNPYGELYEGGTVTYIALQLAYFLGFHEVFLIGVDHNFVAQGSPNEKQWMSGPDPNHFHPDYFAGKEWHLPDLEASEIVYRLAKYCFERSRRRILDATLDGHLEVFPKISYEAALSRCRNVQD